MIQGDPLVDLLAQAAHLALGEAGHAKCLDQIIDRAGGDTLDVDLLDHGCERLLSDAARLEKAREVGAGAQLRDAQFDRAGAGGICRNFWLQIERSEHA
jgi:hypothetical protein